MRFFLQWFVNGVLLVAIATVTLLLSFALGSALPLAKQIGPSGPMNQAKDQPYLPLLAFPEGLRGAVLYLEDLDFYQHWGINTSSIQKAIVANYVTPNLLRGGSSISQQLGRTLLLNTQKTLVRKILELEAALIFEAMLGKDRIFELYLNMVPLGSPKPGFPAAAQFYYQQSIDQLNVDQLVALLTIMPSPSAYKPSNYTDSPLLTKRSAQAYYWFRTIWPRISQ